MKAGDVTYHSVRPCHWFLTTSARYMGVFGGVPDLFTQQIGSHCTFNFENPINFGPVRADERTLSPGESDERHEH